MNKNLLGVLITLVALAGIGAVVYANQRDEQPATSATTQMPEMSQEDMRPGTADTMTGAMAEVQTGTVTMDIKDYAFSKSAIKIKKGTKVVWTNQDKDRHDVMPDNESAAFSGSELLGQGKSYEFTFDTVGIYGYHCSPHPYMKASIEVVE